MANTREEQLKVRNDHPDTFVAVDPGDELRGTLVDVKEAWSDARTNGGREPNRGFYPLLVIRRADDGALIKWHAFSTVAENEVLRIQPLPGEEVTVRYDGESQNAKKGQNAAKLFSLVVEGRSMEAVAHNTYASLARRGGRSGAATPTQPELPAPDADDDIPF